jgi:hypothetical protein
VMLDALMQRGIGKPEEQKQKEEAPPALPTRPTVRGRPPSLQRPGAASPWVQRAPMPLALLPPPQVSYHHSGSPVLGFQEEEHKCLVNLELERRAAKAEEQVKQKDEEVRQKEDEIASLRRQVEHYESRLSECEGRMKSVEDGLQKQITSLQATATTVPPLSLSPFLCRVSPQMLVGTSHINRNVCRRLLKLPGQGGAGRRQAHSTTGRTWRPRDGSAVANPPPRSPTRCKRRWANWPPSSRESAQRSSTATPGQWTS